MKSERGAYSSVKQYSRSSRTFLPNRSKELKYLCAVWKALIISEIFLLMTHFYFCFLFALDKQADTHHVWSMLLAARHDRFAFPLPLPRLEIHAVILQHLLWGIGLIF